MSRYGTADSPYPDGIVPGDRQVPPGDFACKPGCLATWGPYIIMALVTFLVVFVVGMVVRA